MTRRSWLGVMTVSVLATSGAAYYIMQNADEKHLMTPMTVEEVKPAEPAPAQPAQPTPAPTIETKQPVSNEPTRNILFRFPKPAAKSVAIVGDFNNWKRTALTKKEKGWEVSVPLAPGSYKYLYVVDNKRVKDPNNKNIQDGKSVLNVKPAEPKN